jgi:hypothetical protein
VTVSGLFVRPERATVIAEPVGAEYRENIRLPAGRPLVRRMYFDPPSGGTPGPQGFLVEMPGPCTNMAHFHEVDQFQLYFGSNGSWYKRHPLPALTVHYTDAYSTYGPFGSSNDETFRFLTLRPVRSGVAGYLPGARDLLMREAKPTQRRRRNYEIEVSLDGALADGETEQQTLIGRESDGLAAQLISLGPGSAADGPTRDPRSAGRYYYVLRGSIETEGTTFGLDSLGWLGSDDPVPTLVAGQAGCDILALDFPSQWRPTAEAVSR